MNRTSSKCFGLVVAAMAVVLTSATFAWSASRIEGFVPELLKVDLSATEVAPGKTFQMTYYWRNAGDHASLSNMAIIVHFRADATGFYNPDGGSWYMWYPPSYKGPKTAGMPFQADYLPALPTTMWEPGKIVVEGPSTVPVPDVCPDGAYDVLVVPYDRGGYILLGPANLLLSKPPVEASMSYKIGVIKVSSSAGAPVPATWSFTREVVAPAPKPEVKSVAEIKESRAADAAPSWAGKIVMVGNRHLGVALDKSHGCALAAVYVDGTAFESGGKFPGMIVYNKSGRRIELTPDDPRWKISVQKIAKGTRVKYDLPGFQAFADYTLTPDGVNIRVNPFQGREVQGSDADGRRKYHQCSRRQGQLSLLGVSAAASDWRKDNTYAVHHSGSGSIELAVVSLFGLIHRRWLQRPGTDCALSPVWWRLVLRHR